PVAGADSGPDQARAAGTSLALLRPRPGPDRPRAGRRRPGGRDDPGRLRLRLRRGGADRRGDGRRPGGGRPMHAALRQAPSPARCASGGLRVFIAGEPCVLRCSGAMWAPDHSTLIVADLHFEKGSSYARRGQMLPPYDTAATLERLAAEIAALEPRTVILLGDSLHDPEAAD